MAYKEKLEQQGRRRSRKFSTHMEIPDRDVLYRAEVSFCFFASSFLAGTMLSLAIDCLPSAI